MLKYGALGCVCVCVDCFKWISLICYDFACWHLTRYAAQHLFKPICRRERIKPVRYNYGYNNNNKKTNRIARVGIRTVDAIISGHNERFGFWSVHSVTNYPMFTHQSAPRRRRRLVHILDRASHSTKVHAVQRHRN